MHGQSENGVVQCAVHGKENNKKENNGHIVCACTTKHYIACLSVYVINVVHDICVYMYVIDLSNQECIEFSTSDVCTYIVLFCEHVSIVFVHPPH